MWYATDFCSLNQICKVNASLLEHFSDFSCCLYMVLKFYASSFYFFMIWLTFTDHLEHIPIAHLLTGAH